MKIVIIGGSHAGMMAADELLRIAPENEIEIYDRNLVSSFAAEDISAYVRGDVDQLTNLHFDETTVKSSEKVRVYQAHSVISLNTNLHQVTIVDKKQSHTFTTNYDKLIIASGATNRLPIIPGVESENVLVARSFRQVEILQKKILASHKIAIIGAGRSGIEFALAARKLQKNVQIFEHNDQLAIHYVGNKLSGWLQKQLSQNGIGIHNHTAVEEFQQQADGSLILKTNQGDFTADLVLLAFGFVPSTTFVKNELKTQLDGSITVNEYLETTAPDVYAIGDCASVSGVYGTKKTLATRLATRTMRQAFVAAHNVFGQHYRFVPLQSTSGLQVFDEWFAQSGLTLEKAQEWGYQANLVSYEGPWIQEYGGITSHVVVHLTYEISSRKILGIQITCDQNVSQFASIVAVMMQNGNTIDDLAQADILYEQGNGMPLNFLNFVAQRAVTVEKKQGRDQPKITLN